MTAEDLEAQAFDLLREVVTRAKSGLCYREALGRLQEALKQAPGVKKVIEERMRYSIRGG